MLVNPVNSLLKCFEAYKKWVIHNPQLLGDIESTVKCLSYFTAGRFNNSALATELVYSMPNLLVLLNDWLVYSGKFVHLKLPQFESKLKLWLTIVEYVEALLEVTARHIWGDSGKWIIILFVQTIKSVMRLVLVHVYGDRITRNPPVPPLNRDKLLENTDVDYPSSSTREGFALKRTGTMIRSINSLPGSSKSRVFSPLPQKAARLDQPNSKCEFTGGKGNIALAETIYILKPLLHLGCMSVSGRKQWKPWLLSLILDLVSLRMLDQEAGKVTFSKEEREEICRRRISLLLYILRSPFYDNCSRLRIYSMLNTFSRVPLAKLVTEPVAKYLPHWQDTYFYMWSS